MPVLVLVLALSVFALSGCAAHSVKAVLRGESGSSRDAWVDHELAPYLGAQFSTHPRFRGQPLLLVGLSGEEVTSDIDAITATIRARILDSLVQTPGVNLTWRPAARPPQHHRRAPSAECARGTEIAYFIGIEVTQQAGDTLRVAVRALNPHDGAWVSGFGKVWSGRAAPADIADLRSRRPDPYLRGLRVLPFEAGESDLMAAYLARNLSCLLADHDGPSVLYIADDARLATASRSTLELVSNYLAQYREIGLSEDRSQANLILSGVQHRIEGALYQFWATLKAEGQSVTRPSVRTTAYLHVSPPDQLPRTGSVSHLRAHPRIRSFKVAAPEEGGNCTTRLGTARHRRTSGLEPNPCAALELDLKRPADLYLLVLDNDGGLRRAFPGGCETSNPGDATLDAGLHRWQLDRRLLLSPTDGETAEAVVTYYALTLPPSSDSTRLVEHLLALDSECGGRRPQTGTDPRVTRDWLSDLEPLLRNDPDRIEWRSVRLNAGVETL